MQFEAFRRETSQAAHRPFEAIVASDHDAIGPYLGDHKFHDRVRVNDRVVREPPQIFVVTQY